MYVPNYIPAPIEVPGNVTEQPYQVRLGFIRRVAALHFVSLLAVGGISRLELPISPPLTIALEIGITLLLLSIIRISTRATRLDQLLSLCLSPVLVVSLATGARSLTYAGWPVWGVPVGAACALVYSLSCGRDFSFVGQFFLGVIVSSVALAIAAIALGLSPHQAAFLLGSNAAYLGYLVYDSASLLARRRL